MMLMYSFMIMDHFKRMLHCNKCSSDFVLLGIRRIAVPLQGDCPQRPSTATFVILEGSNFWHHVSK